MSETDPRYPIGRYAPQSTFEPDQRAALIDRIAAAPTAVSEAVAGVSGADWEATYREGGWTIRQLVHHLADAHMNGFARFRFALTEPDPAIRPYDEAAWARLPDNDITPPEVSIALLDALHRRWVDMLRGLPAETFRQEAYHPVRKRNVTLDELVGLYAWHGEHHIAHIRQARARGTEQVRT